MTKYLLALLFFLSLISTKARAQTNVELLDQLVGESESEYDRQTQARTQQAAVSANEQVNKGQLTTLKTTYRNIQSRFKTLGLVIDAAEIGLEAAPVVNEIVKQQEQIVSLAQKQPLLILLAANSEADLADQAQLLIDYCYGLVLSIGDVNQMKANDRKMLFSFVVSELRRIDGASRGLLASMTSFYNALNSKSANPFSGFVNQDKSLVDDIIRNAKTLKQ